MEKADEVFPWYCAITVAGPGVRSTGICTLICVAEERSTAAAFPFTVTESPEAAPDCDWVGPMFTPEMVASTPGASAPLPSARFATLCTVGAVLTMLRVAGGAHVAA